MSPDVDSPSLRSLPSVNRVLQSDALREVLTRYRRDFVTLRIRTTLQGYRGPGGMHHRMPSAEMIGEEVRDGVLHDWSPGPCRVINATGVVLHTNLARAPLSQEAVQSVVSAAGYCDLEFDLKEGERGDRQASVSHQLMALTGAEAAFVTVSAAAAVLLVLTALTHRREVLVSRGQSVEIGGGFRIPVVLRQSGAKLVEVGTTNRTRISDYADAVTERTAAILNVHASNFRIVGFAEAVELPDLAILAKQCGIPLFDDNGSGSLLETTRYGLAHEPMVQESVAAGSDIVAFSGDKLLGGPQAGILVGRADLIHRVRNHPLARAVRPDKVTLAALSATLQAYLQGTAERTIPVWAMIGQTYDEILARATRIRSNASSRGLQLELQPGESTIGGGSLPGETLPTSLLVLPPSISAADLRSLDTPIVARTRGGKTLMDLRTVPEADEPLLLRGLLSAAATRLGEAISTEF